MYTRAAYHALSETLFQSAFDHFFAAQSEPRWVVRMFPDLRTPLISYNDEAPMCRGIQSMALENKTIDDYSESHLAERFSHADNFAMNSSRQPQPQLLAAHQTERRDGRAYSDFEGDAGRHGQAKLVELFAEVAIGPDEGRDCESR